jgi:hypothetical protein
MWHLTDPFQDEGLMCIEHSLALPANPVRRHRAGSAIALRSLHHR